MKKNLAVIFGSPSPEYHRSCIGAKSIIDNVDKDLYEVYAVGITKEGNWFYTNASTDEIADGEEWLNNESNKRAFISPNKDNSLLIFEEDGRVNQVKIDVAFVRIPGLYGEDGKVCALLEMAGIPYVGSDSVSSACGLDKAITRIFADSIGLKQPKCVVVYKNEYESNKELYLEAIKEIGYPLFVKPSNAGSSIGISKVIEENEITSAIENALKFSDKVLVEEEIKGTEIKVALYGNGEKLEAGSVCELEAKHEGNKFNDYLTKYSKNLNDKSHKQIPADEPQELLEEVVLSAKKIFNVLGCSDMSRVDFFLTKEKELYFNEINTNPGFNIDSIYAIMLMDKGYTYPELVNGLIKMALDKKRD